MQQVRRVLPIPVRLPLSGFRGREAELGKMPGLLDKTTSMPQVPAL
jgi:hypothetical protein